MGFRHNNVLHKNHFRKDWQRRVKTWFDQAGAKKRRRVARQQKAAALGLKPVQALRPAVRAPTVKYNRKLRAGRGFTLEEIKAAGIRKKEARSIGISVDHRRRNNSEESLKLNVERLTAYKERIVVLPKKGSKAKKVDLSGIQAARLPEAVFPIPAGTSKEAPRAITAEERELNAYETLRKARSDARYAGARKVRAQKAAEEEANKKK